MRISDWSSDVCSSDLGWQVNAGLAILDPTIRQDDGPTLIGKTITFLPKSSASIYTSYEFGDAFVGGGVRYVGSVKTEIDRATRDLPSYTLVDASAGYEIGRASCRERVCQYV